jgi:hypothetical protein
VKVLFLDHYGVLCLGKPGTVRTETSEPTADEFFDTGITVFSDFDSDAVSILNSLLDSVDFEIVVSSDWKRHTTLSGMCEFYQQQGIKKMPLAYTDWLPGATTYHEQRAGEINSWLTQHPEITDWAAVDDLYMGTWLTNFVWAKDVHLGIKDTTVQQQIIELITNQNSTDTNNR